MKEGWTYKKLGEVCDILNGFAFKSNQYVSDGIRVIRITNVQKGFIEDKDPKYYPSNTKDELKRYLLKEDDLLISLTGNVGRVGILDKNMMPAYLNQRVGCLRIKNNDLYIPFLFYFLNSNGFEKDCIESSTGAAQKNMSTVWLSKYKVPTPPLAEQQRIVERLDAAFENIDKLKANAEKQLAEARTLFQKSLAKAMKPKEGWEEKNIGELTDSCLGKMLDKQKNKGEYQPYLRNINVRWGEFDLSDILEMKFEDGEDERYGIQKGDLIICEGGEPGRCAIWEGKMENMKIQKALHRVRSKGEILNRYLYFSIMYYAQSGFLEKFESGATIKHLTGEALRKIPLSYPPLAEQQRIVERLDALSENIRKYEEIQRQIISECDALKQALLRKVFE
jgi:type I restriction enzyme S subunit